MIASHVTEVSVWGSQGGNVCALCLLPKNKVTYRSEKMVTATEKHLKFPRAQFCSMCFCGLRPVKAAGPCAGPQGACQWLRRHMPAGCHCPSPQPNSPVAW